MPREGVPYPERLLCSLRCELKNIWSALSGKLHSVNGVEGDGAGNVNIVSGDAAVVVTTDPSLNQIEVSLDQSQLPAAAVSSVNGQTGAVVLDGTDIETAVYGANNSATQDIVAARTAIQTTNQNINAEATARQNADSALQNNINAEALTRSSDDANLQGQINALPTFSDVSDALDNYGPMVRTTGNQNIGGIKSGNFYTFTGTITSSTADPDEYTSLCNLGASGTAIAIGLTVVTRTNVCIGGIIVNTSGAPTFTGSNIGVSRNITIGIGLVNNEMHLVMRRTSTAGQNISLTIFGIVKGTMRIDPPAGGIGTVTCSSYTEATTI